MFSREDWPYWGALFVIGMGLGILAGLGFEWSLLLVASGALYLAVLVVWWQRRGWNK